MHLHDDPEPGKEALRRLQGQLPGILDDAADVIGKAAVGIGHMARALEHKNFRLLIQPADPGRSAGSSGNAAYNDHFHINLLSTALRRHRFMLIRFGIHIDLPVIIADFQDGSVILSQKESNILTERAHIVLQYAVEMPYRPAGDQSPRSDGSGGKKMKP